MLRIGYFDIRYKEQYCIFIKYKTKSVHLPYNDIQHHMDKDSIVYKRALSNILKECTKDVKIEIEFIYKLTKFEEIN